MIYTALDNFYLTKEQLEASPSAADGVDAPTEAGLRRYCCDVVAEAAVLLRLPQVVAATAQVLIQRFYCKRSLKKFDVKVVAMAAFWLASKLEEVIEIDNPQRLTLRNVITVVDRVTRRRDGRGLAIMDPYSQVGGCCAGGCWVVAGASWVLRQLGAAPGRVLAGWELALTAVESSAGVATPHYAPVPCFTRPVLPPVPPPLPPPVPLQKYEEMKMQAVVAERHMLRAFGFVVHVEHPHRFVLNYCQMLMLRWVLGRVGALGGAVPCWGWGAGLCQPQVVHGPAETLSRLIPSCSTADPASRPLLPPPSLFPAARSCSRRPGTWPTIACAPPCACATAQRSSPAASSSQRPANSRWAALLPPRFRLLLGGVLACRTVTALPAAAVLLFPALHCACFRLSPPVRPAPTCCCRCPWLRAPPGGSCLR